MVQAILDTMARVMLSDIVFVVLALVTTAASAQSCSTTLTANYPAPSVASGYTARIVAQGLKSPRGIIFDSSGHLLVVQQGYGLSSLSLNDQGGTCISVANKTDIIKDATLNHGIELSADGKILYASNSDVVYSWAYSAADQRNTSGPTTMVTGMSNSDHTTRTLLLSQKAPGMLLVSRGSQSNLDLAADNIKSGHSQLKAFNITSLNGPYDFTLNGTLLGWGLRNSVGLAEHPGTGGLFSVENSVDDLMRDGVDVHENNPGEEMNFHGFLNGTRYAGQGGNFGYPNCFAAWNVSEIPSNNGSLQVGQQFAIGTPNATLNDAVCADSTIPPRLTFAAHWAPLDIKFNANGTTAWITSHGSWDRTEPTGYLLFTVAFDATAGMPVVPPNSTTAAVPVLSNQNTSHCPDSCFRPVGLAFDSHGRLFMSSDATGEIYVIARADGSGLSSATASAAQPSPTSSSPSASRTAKSAAAVVRVNRERIGLWAVMTGLFCWLS